MQKVFVAAIAALLVAGALADEFSSPDVVHLTADNYENEASAFTDRKL